MKYKAVKLLFCLLVGVQASSAQTYFDGKFTISTRLQAGHKYTLYDFSRDGGVMKAKFFAQNAYAQYSAWKQGKQVLLVTSAAFVSSWDSAAIPVGLCVEDGRIINRIPDNSMDGLVIVYNGGQQEGGIAVVDLDSMLVRYENPLGSGNRVAVHPRASAVDNAIFLNWAQKSNITFFQTQLVYSQDKAKDTAVNLYYGDPRERRFLAVCKKDSLVHHVIVDAPDMLPLNLSAAYAKTVLENAGFGVLYILNLETGSLNLLYAYNGNNLQNLNPYTGFDPERASLENAPTLLVYYKE